MGTRSLGNRDVGMSSLVKRESSPCLFGIIHHGVDADADAWCLSFFCIDSHIQKQILLVLSSARKGAHVCSLQRIRTSARAVHPNRSHHVCMLSQCCEDLDRESLKVRRATNMSFSNRYPLAWIHFLKGGPLILPSHLRLWWFEGLQNSCS